MQSKNCIGERVHQLDCELTTAGKLIEQERLIEPDHFDDPLHGLAEATEGETATGLTRHRTHTYVEERCGAPVQPHFGLARDSSRLNCGKIYVVVLDRAFEFVGTRACKPDETDVRLDALERRAGRQSVGLRRREKRHYFALVRHST